MLLNFFEHPTIHHITQLFRGAGGVGGYSITYGEAAPPVTFVYLLVKNGNPFTY